MLRDGRRGRTLAGWSDAEDVGFPFGAASVCGTVAGRGGGTSLFGCGRCVDEEEAEGERRCRARALVTRRRESWHGRSPYRTRRVREMGVAEAHSRAAHGRRSTSGESACLGGSYSLMICLFSEIIHMQVSSTPPYRANSAGQAPKSHLTRPSEVKILGSMQDRLQALARSGAVHAVFAFRAEGLEQRTAAKDLLREAFTLESYSKHGVKQAECLAAFST
ncbi:uncharacterized protein MYCGRDRAFT_94941 [Zymoseptoria tritici IPO323]|uniref:Uncharacterized protein n=1 Tax=Zymoseptoria tritici (strain CBS 115943 / IPO323) TaxID=336722 RepID=F9XI61_ZYMTI|nr:uncharacterized protein MYCGRDRAFT_94941 [Zymoseptoria tritici IPO323]EGP84884.1 hypothetical protein MYCGRDRAFT_94941 [Zymoseptoria tritici IPO323]